MGKRYLIDSNVIIDFCNGKLSHKGRQFLEAVEPEISIVTQIELFATQNISKEEHDLLERFIAITLIHPVTADLVKTTVNIRQRHKLKLPDAIIAATAIVLNGILLSHNTSDFKNIPGLQIVDPHKL